MKLTMKYDLENYFFDIDNMRKFDDDEYFHHYCEAAQDAVIEFENNSNYEFQKCKSYER